MLKSMAGSPWTKSVHTLVKACGLDLVAGTGCAVMRSASTQLLTVALARRLHPFKNPDLADG